MLPFHQIDVFVPADRPRALLGNPVAVVHRAEGLDEGTMAAVARWTNLSETTFLLQPTTDRADYRLRIFTPSRELPFAGHPTLGSAAAWLAASGASRDTVVQECGAGLVEVRVDGDRYAFAAPALLRSGAATDAELDRARVGLGLAPEQVLAAEWVDNGPGWLGLRLRSAEDVLGIVPDPVAMGDLKLGVIGPHPVGGPADFEVRAFAGGLGVAEDPVTGSLNAGFGMWLCGSPGVGEAYTVRQGTALRRAGAVDVRRDAAGQVWVGGRCAPIVRGEIDCG